MEINEKAILACRVLVEAYEQSDPDAGVSIDWEDLDRAYALARDAVGNLK